MRCALRRFGSPRAGARSHQILLHPDLQQGLNLQPGAVGKAKPYQLRQLADLVERHGFRLEDWPMQHCRHINLFCWTRTRCWIADGPTSPTARPTAPRPKRYSCEVETAIEAWLEAASRRGPGRAGAALPVGDLRTAAPRARDNNIRRGRSPQFNDPRSPSVGFADDLLGRML